MNCRANMFAAAVFSLAAATVSANLPTSTYTLFETGQVRPVALSTDGRTLFVLNTPDSRLEIFDVGEKSLVPRASVSVGLEPVAIALRGDNEVWVVNHLSDSVSIVDVSKRQYPVVKSTLLVGDEPRDIVFGGTGKSRAFITTAHRGQNNPRDPQLTTPGIGRADVWVFNAQQTSHSARAEPLTVITLFTDTPRALAVTADGSRVYAAGFQTGNRTTVISEDAVPDGGAANGGLPSTRVDAAGEAQPETSLIVQFNGQHWVDELGRIWDDKVRFNLPDKDVFVIDANANPPAPMAGANGVFSGVGTVLFNMAVNPVNGNVYVSNTDAQNLRRFEGGGERLGRNNTVQGHLHESRISVLGRNGVQTRHLNKHIDYNVCCAPIPNPENAKSLAQPMDMAVTRDGRWLYVTAFGSSKVGVFKTREIEDDSFVPNTENQIIVSGGGPSGLALDEKRDRLYVLTRFDNGVSVIDTKRRKEIAHVAMKNPEPESIIKGRRFLYDAALTSSHGDSSCSSCHVFGDFDSLAWDLGNPDETTINNAGPFLVGPTIDFPQGFTATLNPHFRALKGPMATQSLRGMANHGPMHWRGDRTGGNDEPSAQPDSGTFNENAAFLKFNPAFVALLGRSEPLPGDQMQAFADFILQVMYPPNPIRNLDNSLTPTQAAGRALYFGQISDTFLNCNGCHVLDPDGNREHGVAKPGFFGSDGRYSFENETQFLKVPHLRNMYQKVGMFGMAPADFFSPGDNGFKGDQVRGIGFLHDGSTDTLFRFHGATVFVFRPAGLLSPKDPGNPGGIPILPPDHPLASRLNPVGVAMREQFEQFMLAFDSNLAPIVGQQVTFTSRTLPTWQERIDLLQQRADANECDLVARTSHDDRQLGYLYLGNGIWQAMGFNRKSATMNVVMTRPLSHRDPITLTCMPVGSGPSMALGRRY